MPLTEILPGIALLLSLMLAACLLCFRLVFFATAKQKKPAEEYPTPEGAIYDPYRADMVRWLRAMREIPGEEMTVLSHDGLVLRGTFYEYAPGAPVELMFHGYRGTGERDLCGGLRRCFLLGRSALLVDQRASGRSDGKVITFGIHESRDCLLWIQKLIERLGPDCRIILCGISMGASTVLTAAGEPLPHNVVGVLADCGFSSPQAIIRKVIGDLKLPPKLVYPFIRVGAIVFGGFDPQESSALQSVACAKVPIIFFHGESDAYVPCEMSRELFAACSSPKKALITIPEAGHGLAFAVQPQQYLQALRDFFGPELSFDQGRDIVNDPLKA